MECKQTNFILVSFGSMVCSEVEKQEIYALIMVISFPSLAHLKFIFGIVGKFR